MFWAKPGFWCVGVMFSSDSRNSSPFSAKLLFNPASRLVFSNDPEHFDLGAQGDEIVGKVCGSSEKKLFGDEVSHWYGGFARELSTLRVDVSVDNKVPND